MKRSTVAKAFTFAAFTALAMAIAPTASAADKGCSNTSIKGTFAFRATGSHMTPAGVAPLDVVFVQTFDGNGGLTATGVQSSNGAVLPLTQTGTYIVNPDCTGTQTILVSPLGFTVHFFFAITDSGNELTVISTDPNNLSGTARRQFPVGDWRQ
jgi:hypothetical protein